MKLYNIYNNSSYGLSDDTSPTEEFYPDEDYPLYAGSPDDDIRSMTTNDTLWSFLSSFIITLLIIGLAAGLLFVDKSARESAGVYENIEAQAELVRILEWLSSLRWTVRGISPYFILVIELLLLLCRLFSIIAKAIF